MRFSGSLVPLALLLAVSACGGSGGGNASQFEPDGGVVDTGDPDAGEVPCSTGERQEGVCPPAAPALLDPDCPTAAGSEGVCAPAPRESAEDCLTELDDDGLCAPAATRFQDWECPPSWEATPAPTGGGPSFQVCTPPSVPESCAEGTWPTPGAASCAAIGPECPEGFAPEGELRALAAGFEGALVYVAPDGQGNGSRESPLGSLTDALASATAGDVVAVRGTWPGDLTVDGVALVGACVQDTQLGAITVRNGLVAGASVGGIVVPLAAEATVAEVVVTGASMTGVNVRGTAQLRDMVVADTVAVEDVGGWGLFVDGGTVTANNLTLWRNTNIGLRVVDGNAELDDVLVADTLPVSAAPFRGRGLQVEDNAVVTARHIVLARNRNSGFFAAGPVQVILEDAWIGDTLGDLNANTFGDGVTAYDGAQVLLRRTQLTRNRNSGITVAAPRTVVEVDRAVIFDTQIGAVNDYGNGVYAEGGGTVRGSQLAVIRSRGSGVALHEVGTQFAMDDLLIADTLPEASGSFGRGLGLQEGASADIVRGWIGGNSEAGIYAAGVSTVQATDLVVQGTSPDPGTGDFGYGINANSGARVIVERCRIAESTGAGVLAGDEGLVSLRDCSVVDTRAGAEPAPTAITAQLGGRVEVERVALLRNVGVAVACLEVGATFVGTDLLVASTLPTGGRGGRGIEVSRRGELSLERVELRDNRELGLFVQDEGSTAVVSDLVVAGTMSGDDGLGGRAINVQNGAAVEVSRLRAQDNRDACVFVGGPNSRLEVSDAVVVGTQADDAGEFGRAIAVQDAGELIMSRTFVGENTEAGAFTTGVGTVLRLTDVVVRDTKADQEGTFGRGLTVQDGASATLSRVLVAGNRDVGVFAHGPGAAIDAEDLEVRDTLVQLRDASYGRGVGVQSGARFTGERVRIVDNHHVGLLAVAPGTEVDVVDLWVQDTVAVPCVTPPCSRAPGGSGVSVIAADLALLRFSVQGSELAGLQVGPDVQLTAEDGLITNNRIGVNIQNDALDLGASFQRVRVRDNETDRDLGDLPVPSAADTLDELTNATE